MAALSGPQARVFDAEGRDRTVPFTPDLVDAVADRTLLWVDLDEPSERALRPVAEALDLGEPLLALLGRDRDEPRLSIAERRIHLRLIALEPDDASDTGIAEPQRLDLVTGPGVVLTVHDGPVAALRRFVDSLDGETRLGSLDAADLLSSLVDDVLVGYLGVVEAIERQIDELDQRALHQLPGDDVLAAIVAVRKRISRVRRVLAPHRQALAALGRPELGVEDGIGTPWPGLHDRLDRALDGVEALRDALLGTYDIHMGRVSQRANDTMRVLTLLSAVLLPSVVLAGIMGMNFKIPFFDVQGNFFLVIGAMIVLAIVILAVARRQRWW